MTADQMKHGWKYFSSIIIGSEWSADTSTWQTSVTGEEYDLNCVSPPRKNVSGDEYDHSPGNHRGRTRPGKSTIFCRGTAGDELDIAYAGRKGVTFISCSSTHVIHMYNTPPQTVEKKKILTGMEMKKMKTNRISRARSQPCRRYAAYAAARRSDGTRNTASYVEQARHATPVATARSGRRAAAALGSLIILTMFHHLHESEKIMGYGWRYTEHFPVIFSHTSPPIFFF